MQLVVQLNNKRPTTNLNLSTLNPSTLNLTLPFPQFPDLFSEFSVAVLQKLEFFGLTFVLGQPLSGFFQFAHLLPEMLVLFVILLGEAMMRISH